MTFNQFVSEYVSIHWPVDHTLTPEDFIALWELQFKPSVVLIYQFSNINEFHSKNDEYKKWMDENCLHEFELFTYKLGKKAELWLLFENEDDLILFTLTTDSSVAPLSY